jgi:hypothetical protein
MMGMASSRKSWFRKSVGPQRVGFLTMALAIALLTPQVLFAQNCALCYSQAAASGQRVIEALRSGILILVFPPMLIFAIFTIMAYRKRNQFNAE